MKIIAINGSPRKKWNTAQLMDSFINGIMSIDTSAEIQIINVYDYLYTGCKSCFGCKLKNVSSPQCVIKDDIHDLLIKTRNSDGVIFGAPVYFFDLPAQLRAFMERLLYPGPTVKSIPSAFIYTMNATEELMKEHFQHNLNSSAMFIESNFKSKPQQIFSFDTYQRDREELYKPSRHDMNAKKERHEKQFPIDIKDAYEAGKKMAIEVSS